jgi:hypothetical protein
VDQRLLAILWLLAESWGHVTPAGTRLPLTLTHDALGGLIGARRPTVTLALGDLTERGAIVRQDRGWLLLEAPAEPSRPAPTVASLDVLIDDLPSGWESTAPARLSPEQLHGQLRNTITRLHSEHLATRDSIQQRLATLAATRERVAASRRRIALESLSRRRAPS